MHLRREARRAALDLLYGAEARGLSPSEMAFDQMPLPDGGEVGGSSDSDPDVLTYARVLASGVESHQEEIDGLIDRYADRWSIDRMPVVDKLLLRIAVFELLWRDDVPVAVVINEAVELAKGYSTEDSGRFLNGLLGKIAELGKTDRATQIP